MTAAANTFITRVFCPFSAGPGRQIRKDGRPNQRVSAEEEGRNGLYLGDRQQVQGRPVPRGRQYPNVQERVEPTEQSHFRAILKRLASFNELRKEWTLRDEYR